MDTDQEVCPKCGGPMQVEWIRDHDAWVCPIDAYAFAVDQDGLDDLGYDDL